MIARNMTLGVLAGSLLMFAVAVGCGERASAPDPEPTTALPASSGEQTDEGKAEGEGTPVEIPEPTPSVAAPEPAEAEGPTLGEAELTAGDGVRLRRLAVATAVEDHEPVGAAGSFEGRQRLYAFVDVVNETPEHRQVLVTFEGPDGRSVGHVGLDVPADVPRWRTWGYSRMVDRPGLWEAVVRTEDGELLGRVPFRMNL